MFKNYLIIALRTFRKRKSFSLINLAGLAVGVACFWLISLYVQFELSFDRYHEKSDRIYRVVAHQPGNIYLGTDHFAVTQAVLAKTLKQEYPEVLAAVTIDDANNVLISVDEKDFYEDGLLMADDELFELFDFPFLVGDPKTALAELFSIVLTEEVAHKYFGNKTRWAGLSATTISTTSKSPVCCKTSPEFTFSLSYADAFSSADCHG